MIKIEEMRDAITKVQWICDTKIPSRVMVVMVLTYKIENKIPWLIYDYIKEDE